MTNNKDLFKQAIAEAKSVREAAVANAKEALEETLTPHLKDMLAAKLQEMEDNDMEEDVLDEKMHDDSKMHEEENEIEDDSVESDDEIEGELEDETEEEEDIEDMSVEELKDLIRDIVAQEMGEEEIEDELDDQEAEDEIDADDMVGADDEEEIDLDELLSELSDDSYTKEVEEGHYSGDQSDVAGAAAGLDNIIDSLKKVAKKGGEVGKRAVKALEDLGSSAGAGMKNEADKKASHSTEGKEYQEMKEAVRTIKKLQSELNEVNVLNAKLLYLNKIFKASNLTENQKVNIIAAFDNAETVKEAKLIYNTVAESSTKPEKKSRGVNESRLGMASKATGTTAKKPEVITESSEAVKRMQKLAGIIK